MRILALLLLLGACGPSTDFQQERVFRVSFLPHGVANPVEFGQSLERRHDLADETLAMIDSRVGAKLPGVRFLVLNYPVWDPNERGFFPSYRTFTGAGRDAYVVLGWREGEPLGPGLHLDGLDWEVLHLVSGTDDNGNPVRDR